MATQKITIHVERSFPLSTIYLGAFIAKQAKYVNFLSLNKPAWGTAK